MDEILFRGKTTKEAMEGMGEESSYTYKMFNFKDGFVYGHLITGYQPYIVGPIEEVNNEYCSMEWWCPIIPETIGQYIGLTDKNGKKIFVGDILRVTVLNKLVSLIEIRFLQGAFCASTVGIDYYDFEPLEWTGNKPFDPEAHYWQFEVVGNIYDNPELLTDTKGGNYEQTN